MFNEEVWKKQLQGLSADELKRVKELVDEAIVNSDTREEFIDVLRRIMDDKINNDLVSKVYGDFNAWAINMGADCDCDMEVKQPIVKDYLGYHPKPDDKQFFVIDYLDCLKPDKTL